MWENLGKNWVTGWIVAAARHRQVGDWSEMGSSGWSRVAEWELESQFHGGVQRLVHCV